MVLSEKVDAMVSDYHACVVATLRNPDAGLVTLFSRFTYEPLGIAISPEDSHMLAWMENFLGTLEGSGDLERMKLKWVKNPRWIRVLP